MLSEMINDIQQGNIAGFVSKVEVNISVLLEKDLEYEATLLHWIATATKSSYRSYFFNLIKLHLGDQRFIELLTSSDKFGRTPLHLAAELGALEIVNSIHQTLTQVTSTQYLDVQDINGNTALHKAVYANHVPIIRTLLSFGCNSLVKNTAQQMAIDLAISSEVHGILKPHMQHILTQVLEVPTIIPIQQSAVSELSGTQSMANTQERLFEKFKSFFTQHLSASAEMRFSFQPHVINRRLDSLARLLEQNMTCVSVTYDSNNKKILIATNTIFETSKETNGSLIRIERVMQLLCNHQANIEIIIDELADILKDNILAEERFLISALHLDSTQLKEQLILLFDNLFDSGEETKQWRDKIDFNDFRGKINEQLFSKVVPRLSKVVRDFLKLRESLMMLADCKNPVEKTLLTAINEKKYQVVKRGRKGAHAETRIIDEINAESTLKQGYVGISKLCCAHCGLAVKVANLQVRGQHGRGFKWFIPQSFFRDYTSMQAFMGRDAFAAYWEMSNDTQEKAIAYIQSGEGAPSDKKARRMLPDSSDSDCEFGMLDSDDELSGSLNQLSLQKIWILRQIKWDYPNELERLEALQISRYDIVLLFQESKEKFVALGSEDVFSLLKNSDESDLFECLSSVYDKDEQFFWDITTDKNDLINSYGFEEVYDVYKQTRNQIEKYDSDGEENDIYEIVSKKLEHEYGWDYDYNSDDTENQWDYTSSCSFEYQSDNYDEDLSSQISIFSM